MSLNRISIAPFLATVIGLVVVSTLFAADPPGILNHQGRILVNGANHDGDGYFKFAFVNGGAAETYWTNDGTNTGTPGGEPAAAVTVAVSKGHYAVGLGNTAVANMTSAIPPTVFASNTDVRLRVWFSASGGVGTFTLLSPDRRITSGGYAMHAAGVSGAVTVANNSEANPSAGAIRWTGTDFEGFNGTDWVSLTTSSYTGHLAGFMDFASVGNPGNPPDQDYGFGQFGAVASAFHIGRHEVTNMHYTEFLNAVAAADPNELYNVEMDTHAFGGITRSGASGNFTYAVKAGQGNRPVIFVSWYDALRFCNWLHNERRPGAQDNTTTEYGAYTLTGPTSIGTGTDPVYGSNGRNAGARFYLPSENQWYKAAYHQPAAQGGDVDDYWLYPTATNTALTSGPPPGGTNSANILPGGPASLTDIGAYNQSPGFYGTFDQAGNVFEWNEQLIGLNRGIRGGSVNYDLTWTVPSFRITLNPVGEADFLGFRVASP